MINDDVLKRIMPRLSDEKRADLLQPLQAAMDEFGVNTPKREAAFLAQIAHESNELTVFAENLNYGAKGLMDTWPKHFPDLLKARRYERKPEQIANYVYANRIGNGDEASEDGWRFRGRGPIQITGRENYAKYGALIGIDLVNNPKMAETADVGLRVAGLFWQKNGLNELADQAMFETITRKINGKLNGLESRKMYYVRAGEVLGVPTSRGSLEPESDHEIPSLPEFTRGAETFDVEPSVRRARQVQPQRQTRTPARPAKKKALKKVAKNTPKKAVRKAPKKVGRSKRSQRKIAQPKRKVTRRRQ